MKFTPFYFFYLCAGSCALAGTIRHDVADSSYTALSANSKYVSVGAVLGTKSGSGFIGSGALIASDWVLTAAHVVGGTDNQGAGITDLRFVQGPNANAAATFADQWIPIPGWNGNSSLGLDVGLIHLDSEIFGVSPAIRYVGTSEKTQTVTHVGYGRTGTGLTGDTTNPGTRRAGNNVIDKFGGETATFNGTHYTLSGNSNLMYSDFDRPSVASESSMGSTTPLALEYQIAGGDSGGPAFIEPVAGQPVIAAVHTFLAWLDSTGNADYADLAGSTRLNGVWQTTKIINDWISSTITVAGDADSDFDVDLSDLGALATNYGINSGGHWHMGDFDLDGDVDLSDLGSLATNYGGGNAQAFADFQTLTSIPEPTAISLFVFNAVAMLQRRRKNRTH